MNYEAINQLIEKYFEGLTTLEEEKMLRKYFEQEDLPKDQLALKPLFNLNKEKPVLKNKQFDAGIETQLTDHRSELGKTFRWPLVATAAAIVLLFFSLFDFNRSSGFEDTFNDPTEAYAHASKALQFVGLKLSDGMNATIMAETKLDKGLSKMEKLTWINAGIENTRRLGEIDQTRNLLNLTHKP
ncbi:MAG: hypothetical protein PHG67_03335 [Bacteroidales bacterium]|jgi:hypothetical protein|nr:hypothetical protein [Bacteroidales bacterium]HOI32361.1 hypothetical protein [Bacteroidales bacterium]